MSENRRIHLRVGTAAEWVTHNPILANGEPGYESDTEILRIGDGSTAFTSLTGLSMATLSALRQIATGTGLTGGGNLTADRTIALVGQALALHNLATSGMIARTGAGAVAARTITGTANQIAVTNGDGVAGNPTLALSLPSQAEAEAGTDANKPMPALRVKQAIAALTPPVEGLVLLGTLTTTSGTSQTLTGLALADYKFLMFDFVGVSHGTADVQASFRVGGVDVISNVDRAENIYGTVLVSLTSGRVGFGLSDSTTNNTGYSTASTSVSVSTNVNGFDAGSIRVYGLK